MTPALPILLMVGAEVDNLSLSVPILTLNVIANDMRDTRDLESVRVES